MDVELKPEDLAFSEYPEPITGGMHVGLPKGVMAVHLPTGIKVVCNHERSQHMNRDACLRAISAALNNRHGAGDAEAVDYKAKLIAMHRRAQRAESDLVYWKRWSHIVAGIYYDRISSTIHQLGRLTDSFRAIEKLRRSRRLSEDAAMAGDAVDSARLDWLIEQHATLFTDGEGYWQVAWEFTNPATFGPMGKSPRAAIDAARAGERG